VSSVIDLSALLENTEKREQAADRIRVAKDINLPFLEFWNSQPCRQHRKWVREDGTTAENLPKPGCIHCGIIHRQHQRIGSTWLFLKKRALLADSVGTGKTVHSATLIAMMKEAGEIEDHGRVLFVCRPAAILQHRAELQRMLPGVSIEVAMGTKRQRIDRYLGHWEVMIIGQQMCLQDLDDFLLRFDYSAIIVDDVDALRNRSNKTAYAIKKLAAKAPRCVIMTGTPLQKKLHELHSVLEPLGGRELFGSEASFLRRYVRMEQMTLYNHRSGRKHVANKVVGYKNIGEFKRLISPLALRRTAADLEDVELPTVNVSNVYLELYPLQRAKYKSLQKGVLEILKEEGSQVKQATSLTKLHYGAQICTGLAALGEPDIAKSSIKLDWLMENLGEGGDLEGEKVVVFLNYKNTIQAFAKRLSDARIGHEIIWGEEPDKAKRKASQDRFWQDPNCKVLMGTTAIEQSLNLQCARHLINVNQIMNPARMEQLAGRIRRDGSAFKHVFVHNLLTADTQEARYMPMLEREQALIDAVWSEESELFESLPPMALLQLISG
jgi:SNF2 family DNA or RNA helicase